jgi:hypothetical protein
LLCYCMLGTQEEEKDEDKSIWFEITGWSKREYQTQTQLTLFDKMKPETL